MKILFKVFLGLLLLLLLVVPGAIFITKKQNDKLLNNVESVVIREADFIQLPHELVEEREINSLNCSYDTKVGAKRCRVRVTKYYVVSNDMLGEYEKINAYLEELGWKSWSSDRDKTKGFTRQIESGYAPSDNYEKKV